MTSKKRDPNHLQDGFQEVFVFRGHKVQPKGCWAYELVDDYFYTEANRKQFYISWDSRHIIQWEKRKTSPQPRLLRKLEFQDKPANFISAVTYVPKIKMFIAAALDMSFLIYDRQLNLIESIHHGERAILHMEYIHENGLILISGAAGVSFWRMYRHNSMATSMVMEKLKTLPECDGWVSHTIYDKRMNKLYALMDTSAYVFNMTKQTLIAKLDRCHDAPLTRACYYGRSQFYITGCSEGLIKCWTSHFEHSTFGSQRRRGGDDDDVDSKFALMHTFKCHTRAITCLTLHVVPGLLISSSLDGFIKVLNLEALNELYHVHIGYPILDLKLAASFNNSTTLVFTQVDGTIATWRITSCSKYFGLSSSMLKGVALFDSMQFEVEKLHADARTRQNANSLPKSVIASHGAHDLRLFTESGQVLCHMEPQVVVEGIVAYAVSVYQEMIFTLMESGELRAFCMRSFVCPMLRQFQRSPGHSDGGGVSGGGSGGGQDLLDKGTSMTLINVMPATSVRPDNDSGFFTDLRNNPVPNYITEILVVGSRNGTVTFYDTLNDCEMIYVTHVNSGVIEQVKYRRHRSELCILGYDESHTTVSIKVWHLPEMICTHQINGLLQITAFDISPTMGLFGVGTVDGYVRLFQISPSNDQCHEVLAQGLTHDTTVTNINFFDQLKIYVTCAIDSSVIVWNYQKQVLRSIKFHMPTYAVVFYGQNGDVLITQGAYLLNIARTIWDEGNVLQKAIDNKDPWIENATDWDADAVQEQADIVKKQAAKQQLEGTDPIAVTSAAVSVASVISLADDASMTAPPVATLAEFLKTINTKVFITEKNVGDDANGKGAVFDRKQLFSRQADISDTASAAWPPHVNADGLASMFVDGGRVMEEQSRPLVPRLRLPTKPTASANIHDGKLVDAFISMKFLGGLPQSSSQRSSSSTKVPMITASTSKKFAKLGMSPRARLALIHTVETEESSVQNRVNDELSSILAPSTLDSSYRVLKDEIGSKLRLEDMVLKPAQYGESSSSKILNSFHRQFEAYRFGVVEAKNAHKVTSGTQATALAQTMIGNMKAEEMITKFLLENQLQHEMGETGDSKDASSDKNNVKQLDARPPVEPAPSYAVLSSQQQRRGTSSRRTLRVSFRDSATVLTNGGDPEASVGSKPQSAVVAPIADSQLGDEDVELHLGSREPSRSGSRGSIKKKSGSNSKSLASVDSELQAIQSLTQGIINAPAAII